MIPFLQPNNSHNLDFLKLSICKLTDWLPQLNFTVWRLWKAPWYPCPLVNLQKKKKKKKQKQQVQTSEFIICSASVCDELNYFATMGRTDTRGLPQYVVTHTWIWSSKGRLTAEACWTYGAAESGTIGWAANSIRRAWKGMSRQGRFKSPLKPKWVVLSLWVTVQSPGIRTEILKEGWLSRRNIHHPRAHTSTELDSCYTDFI